MNSYKCSCCKNTFSATTEFFFSGCLNTATRKQRDYIPKCKKCAKQYLIDYRNKLRKSGLSVSGHKPYVRNVKGKVYIIGTKDKETPYKIGYTSGTDARSRLSCLQTGNWDTLEMVYESPYVDNVMKEERNIHFMFREKVVRGEWYELTEKDISKVEQYFELIAG